MRRVRYGLIVLILGLVAACTSDADPKPSSTPGTPSASVGTKSATPPITRSPSPSVATTGPNVKPGETVPVLPALAKTNSRPGAAAFAYYWFQALDWGYATTDSTLAKSLYLPQCSDCARFVGIFDRAKAQGQHFKDGRITLQKRTIVSDDERHPGTTVVDVVLSAAPLRTVDASGRTLSRDPAVTSVQYRLWNKWIGTGWRLLDYKRVIQK